MANRNPSDKSFQRLGGELNSPGTVKADQLPIQKCFCLPGLYLRAVEIDDWAERVWLTVKGAQSPLAAEKSKWQSFTWIIIYNVWNMMLGLQFTPQNKLSLHSNKGKSQFYKEDNILSVLYYYSKIQGF